MAIHHTYLRKALNIGCHISEGTNGKFRIFWPKRSVELFCNSPTEAISEMVSIQRILEFYPDYKITPQKGTCRITVVDSISKQQLARPPTEPTTIQRMIEAGEDKWMTPDFGGFDDVIDPTRIAGISMNGAVAHREGAPASDCPFLEDSPEFKRWNDEWDTEADRQITTEEETPKPKGTGSVVTNKYRAIYAESGHVTNCGDSLATLLNNVCKNKAGTNLELFEAICMANGVDLSGYDRTNKGWRGRIRMTGRNMLAKKVREQGGKVNMPPGYVPESYQLDRDWMEVAATKYKPKRPG